MITLNVARDRKGRLLILSPQPPKGLKYVFRKAKKPKSMEKKLRAMWKEFDDIVDNHRHGEHDSFQQKTIKRLVEKHFGFCIDWDDVDYGWPTAAYWPASKIYINKIIRRA